MIAKEIKKIKFRKEWRKRNNHNFTIAASPFPTEKVIIGNYTYGVLNIKTYGGENERLQIGHFVSIGNDSKFILGGNHPSDTLSTYPFRQKIYNKQTLSFSKGPIVIEDDVWIGENVIILSGVTIGQGAIIGTGSVVTKNVEPYSLVVGNPAVFKKYRFSSEIITELLKVNFGNLTPAIIEESIDFLSFGKIENVSLVKSFIQKIDKLNHPGT